MKPRSINIFLLDGDPNGIRVAQIMMSVSVACAPPSAFSRDLRFRA